MKEIQDKKKKKITPIPYHSNTYYSVFRNKPLLSKGIDQACQQCSLILLLIKQTKFNALNVISTLFLIFTAPMHQNDTITPLHVVYCSLDESSFYTASGNF